MITYWWFINRLQSLGDESGDSTWRWIDRIGSLHAQAFRKKSRPLTSLFELELRYNSFDSLPSILSNGRFLQFTDNRDHIYGLLGLAKVFGAHAAVDIKPNYMQPAPELYRKFAQDFTSTTKSLKLLIYVQPEVTANSHLESWIPRWDDDSGDYGFLPIGQENLGGSSGRILESASGISLPPKVLDDGKLHVRGVVFDAVHARSAKVADGWFDGVSSETFQILADFWNETLNWFCEKNMFPADHFQIAFANVLTSGGYYGNEKEWADHQAAFLMRMFKSGAKHARVRMGRLQLRAKRGNESVFSVLVASALNNRRLVVTERGYYGLVEGHVEDGDIFVTLCGPRGPCVLRPMEGGYRFLVRFFIPSRVVIYAGSGWEYFPSLGLNLERDDWTKWGLPEQDFFLCK